MPLCGRYRSGAVALAVWRVEESVSELLSMLGASDASCVDDFTSVERCRERLAVRVLLKLMCGADAAIVYDAAGKPSLKHNEACISVSHTKGYAALAVSCEKSVGLDIELLTREVGAVSRRFMRDEELAGVPSHQCNAAKLLRWTASEALFKLVGNLGGNYRDNIVLERAVPACGGVLSMSLVGLERGNGSYSVAYLFDAPLLLTLCCEGACEPLCPAGGI